MDKMVLEMGRASKKAARAFAHCTTREKNQVLETLCQKLLEHEEAILQANAQDVAQARANGMSQGLLDRLSLNHDRILGMVEGVKKVIDLDDPIGEVVSGKVRPNGMEILKKRVPLGVVAIIYESRPNVTIDTAALCLKSSNALILRGGKESYASNAALTAAVQAALEACGMDPKTVQLIKDEGYAGAQTLMRMKDYVDVLIPRGSARLIQSTVENATVPVIETGVGNCHVYVDASADLDMAHQIVINAKTRRVGVCNAMETLLVHESVAEAFLPRLFDAFEPFGVTVYGDEKTRAIDQRPQAASEADWSTEYLDYACACKVVSSLEEAIDHINTYGSLHSEVIVTESYEASKRFTADVDAACVYVNVSSRFTDGFEFGMGAEMGISTQKMHVRGPIGLEALTSSKYVIQGEGQVRP